MKIKPKYYWYSGISDANILINKKIKILNLGDGVKNPHTPNESIAVKNLKKLTEIIGKIINKFQL